MPETGFNCAQQQYLPGIYTDTAADCQVIFISYLLLVVRRSLLRLQPFYMCEENGRSTAFLCPNGTIFNQQYFVCDWWILNDWLQPFGQPRNFQVVQHWLCSPARLLQLEPVHLWWARRGWVHPYPSLIIPFFLWRPTMQLSLLYRWLAEAGKCCCVCR